MSILKPEVLLLYVGFRSSVHRKAGLFICDGLYYNIVLGIIQGPIGNLPEPVNTHSVLYKELTYVKI